MPQIDLTLDDEIYAVIKDTARKLRLPPRMFLRALIATVVQEAMEKREEPDRDEDSKTHERHQRVSHSS